MGELVDPDDLIGAAEVQHILKLSHPNSVTTYLKRYDDFPQPVVVFTKVLVWDWSEVEAWSRRTGRM